MSYSTSARGGASFIRKPVTGQQLRDMVVLAIQLLD